MNDNSYKVIDVDINEIYQIDFNQEFNLMKKKSWNYQIL